MSGRIAWITGANGLIGSHLARTAARFAPGWQVIPLTRQRLELTDLAAVTRVFTAQKPALVIHCAALSRSAACQTDPGLAETLNVSVTRHLAELSGDVSFIFLSTDLVFDGLRGNYVETDPVNPLSIYAETKAKAEQLVLENPRHTILRLSLNTGTSPSGDRSFTEEMRRAWSHGESLRLFMDEFRNPLPAIVTAQAIWELAHQDRPGLYHLAGCERLSRWEIGEHLARRWPGLQARMEPASLRDYCGPARSPDTSLNSSKLQALLSFPLPGFTQWLRDNPEEPV